MVLGLQKGCGLWLLVAACGRDGLSRLIIPRILSGHFAGDMRVVNISMLLALLVKDWH